VDYGSQLYLAKQGVLLFNAALTTEFNKVGSHLEIWEPFTKYVISEALAYTGIPIIFLGKEAGKFQRYVAPFTHSFVLDHPAYAARTNSEWETKNVFKKVNQIIWENNKYKIEWLKEQN
jgi:uracil DNA glycosylase